MRREYNILIGVICATYGLCTNAYCAIKIEAASFPTTAADISFSDKMDILAQDYQNYEGLSPYEIITIERATQQRQYDRETMSHSQYCTEYPLVPECNPTPETEAAVMAMGYAQPGNSQNAAPQGIAPVTDDENTDNTPTAQNRGDISNANPPNRIDVQSIVGKINAMAHSGNNNSGNNNHNINNNSVVGGQCTPSQRYAYFDKGDWHKLTSHRYDASYPAFAKAMFNLMRVERPECAEFSGQYGGTTCYGYTSVSNPDINVRNLTLNSAEDRTFRLFYKDTGIYKLPDHIMGDVMHVSFWRGTSKGIKALNTVLGLSCGKRCSVVSDQLVTAAKNYSGDLHNKYWDRVWKEVISYDSNRKFLKGFGERVQMARQNGCHSTGSNPINF